MRPTVTLIVLSAFAAAPVAAQGMLATASNVPAWADSVFRHSPAAAGYDYESRLTPDVAIADFDGDGLLDVAVGVRSGGLDRGVAVIHRIDGSVHILGAGRDVGDGSADIRSWGVARLLHGKSAIVVQRSDNHNGLLVWDGQDYRWVPDQ